MLSDQEVGETRIAYFRDLKPTESQRTNEIPLEVADIILSRKLLPVISLDSDDQNPFVAKAPIRGAAGITVTYAVCPPGTGPSLHKHHRTYETFTVMKGQFELRWGKHGQQKVVLQQFDTMSVPPAIYRAFRNVSDDEGILQVIISGGIHDRKDISFPKATAVELASHGEKYLQYFINKGLQFTD